MIPEGTAARLGRHIRVGVCVSYPLPRRANFCKVAHRDHRNGPGFCLAENPVRFNQVRRQEVDREPVAAPDSAGVHLLKGKVVEVLAARFAYPPDPYGGVQSFQRRRGVPR